jgi:hypothetical protein
MTVIVPVCVRMLVIGIEMAVRVRMAGAVGMGVLMLVKDDFEPPAKHIGDPAQGLQARHVIAALEARDHRLGHGEPLRQRSLRFAGAAAQLQELARALRGDGCAIVGGLSGQNGHRATLRRFAKAKLSKVAKPPSIRSVVPSRREIASLGSQ